MRNKLRALIMPLLVAIALSALGEFGKSVSAYNSALATYTWGPGTPNYNSGVVIHPGTISFANLVMGDFLGIRSDWPTALGFGDMGVSVGWDDTWGPGEYVGNPNTNGDRLDGLYVQIGWDTEGWWDLGFATNRIVVFTCQDHDPYLGEGLEYRVYGTNTLWTGSLSPQAILTDVYLDGWRTHNSSEDGVWWLNGWCSDDITGVLRLDAAYRYIRLVSWDPQGSPSGFDEPEVDAIAGVARVRANVDIKPDTLSLHSSGIYAAAWIELPLGYDVNDIDVSSIILAGNIPVDPSAPWTIGDYDYDTVPDLMVKFDRQALIHYIQSLGIATPASVTLDITGALNDGTPFEGTDTIQVKG